MGVRIIAVRLVEIVVISAVHIVPCSVHIIKSVLQTDNIPRMAFPGVAGAVVAGNSHLLQQILESPCISGADRLSVYQRAVSALIHLRARIIGYPVN